MRKTRFYVQRVKLNGTFKIKFSVILVLAKNFISFFCSWLLHTLARALFLRHILCAIRFPSIFRVLCFRSTHFLLRARSRQRFHLFAHCILRYNLQLNLCKYWKYLHTSRSLVQVWRCRLITISYYIYCSWVKACFAELRAYGVCCDVLHEFFIL